MLLATKNGMRVGLAVVLLLYMSTSHPSMAALASVLDLFLKDRRRETMKGIAAYARHTNVLTADFSV